MITSDVGSRSIVFTNPSSKNGDVEVYEKNAKPTINKTASVSSAAIGDTVTYKVYVNATPGSENLKVTDRMTAGLRFNGADSMGVTFQAFRGGEAVALAKADANTAESPATYTIEAEPDGSGFSLVLNPAFLQSEAFLGGDNILGNDGGVFTLAHTATVTAAAMDADKVSNNATLTYGHKPDSDLETRPDKGIGDLELDRDTEYTVKWLAESGDVIHEAKYTPKSGDFPAYPENPDTRDDLCLTLRLSRPRRWRSQTRGPEKALGGSSWPSFRW